MYSGTCFLSLNIMLEIVSTFGVAVQKEGRKEGRKGGREGEKKGRKEGREGGREKASKQAICLFTREWIMTAWYMKYYSGVNLNDIKIDF